MDWDEYIRQRELRSRITLSVSVVSFIISLLALALKLLR